MRHLEYVQSSPELETVGAAVRHGRFEGSQSSISCKENISPVDPPIQNHTGLVFCRRDPALAQGFREQVLGNDAADLRRDAASDPEELGKPVRLIQNWVDGGFEVAPGEVVLLENCRCNKGEKKDNEELARKMAALCDVYVNDAFGTAHRAEATTHGIARFAPTACAGILMGAEIDALGKALHSPKRPLVAIVGGSKVSSKLTILKSLADKVDQLIVGGGIANTFMLAAGLPIGRSLAEPDLLDQARAVIAAMKARGADVPIPVDVVVAKAFKADAEATVKEATDVAADDLILDVGPRTAALLAERAGRKVELIVEEETNPKDSIERLRKLVLQDKVDCVQGIVSSGVSLAIVSADLVYVFMVPFRG